MLKPMIECPAVGRVCSARVGPHSPLTPPQNYPPDWERWATPTLPNRAGNPASTFMSIQAFLRRTHPPYGGSAVGRVCSARARPNLPQAPPQNYPPDWERRATPTFPNQAGNPASAIMSIRAFFAPDTPALRLACLSQTSLKRLTRISAWLEPQPSRRTSFLLRRRRPRDLSSPWGEAPFFGRGPVSQVKAPNILGRSE
jgi:hypothetical protein